MYIRRMHLKDQKSENIKYEKPLDWRGKCPVGQAHAQYFLPK
jgi:hypothetical protein